MFPCSLLPTSLLVILFAFPALAAPSSPNDPFRDIALQAPKRPEPEICCLRPLEPLEPIEREDVLLSFEDWKAKRLGETKGAGLGSNTPTNTGHRPSSGGDGSGGGIDGMHQPGDANNSVTPSQSSDGVQDCSQDADDLSQTDDWLFPQSHIPIVDRFNYASMDCSARVHTSHRSAKSPSSILSSKKDRYMLSPCAEEHQFVVVELCDDIMIDTVQLANFEFFSGVFKDFTVKVAKTYTTEESGWTYAGTHHAQNIRGVQTFHPASASRDFYRFIRIDFHSHYGNEFYCPLSLLRVYGLTHLEQWKLDEWKAQSKTRHAPQDASVSVITIPETQQVARVAVAETPPSATIDKSHPNPVAEVAQAVGSVESAASSNHKQSHDSGSVIRDQQVDAEHVHNTSFEGNGSSQEAQPSVSDDGPSMPSPSPRPELSHSTLLTTSNDHNLSSDISRKEQTEGSNTSLPAVSSPSSPVSSGISSHALEPSLNSHSEPSDISNSTTASLQSTQTTRHVSSSISSVPTVSVSVASYSPPPPPPHVATGGESIYRTIMNRLTALEANTTLYARYVEEQTAGVREMLRRLGEDVGRLEGIGKAQAQMYQRSITEFDRQRRRLEIEHNELLMKVNHLTDEVVLEKRLGIAQLCLLMAVLVFMTLTRGSRGEHLHRVSGLAPSSSMREWGRRTLSMSLSGDLLSRFRSRSPASTPKPTSQRQSRSPNTASGLNQVAFPSQEPQRTEGSSSRSKSMHPSVGSRKLGSRPRTPSTLRTSTPRHYNYSRPAHHGATHSTPLSATPRPVIQRSTSGGVSIGDIGPVPKSAKRWARSAHLHEVKSAAATLIPETTPPYEKSLDSAGSSRTILAEATNNANADLFSPQANSAPARPGLGNSHGSRSTLSPLRFTSTRELPRGCVVHEGPTSEGDVSEGDGWVDTDADGSESELGESAGAEGKDAT